MDANLQLPYTWDQLDQFVIPWQVIPSTECPTYEILK